MKAIPFPQANKVLKAPPSPRQEIQALIDKLAANGADMSAEQAKLDAAMPADNEVHDLHVWGGVYDGAEHCISCWEPTPQDRAAVAAGGPVWLSVVGHTHPPLVLFAQNPFEESSSFGEAAPTVSESFRALLARLTLTPEEERSVAAARVAASNKVESLLAIIDRLTDGATSHQPSVAAQIANEMMEESHDISQGAPHRDLAGRLEEWARRLRGATA